MLEEYITIVFRSLSHRSLRSWLTLLGIFIGIAAVVSLIALGEGFQSAITEQFSEAGTDKLTIQAKGSGFAPPGSSAVNRLTEDDLEVVKNVRGYSTVGGRLLRNSRIEFNDKVRFGFVISMPEDPETRRLIIESMNLEVDEGRIIESGDKFKVTLGSFYQDTKYFEKDVNIRNKIIIQDREFKITGFLDKMSNPQFNDMILMNEEVMRDLLGIEEDVDFIVGQVQNIDDIEEVAERTKRELRKTRNVERGKEDFTVETPQQSLETFNTILNIVQAVIVGIAAISLLVGGVGIANTMFTAVLERRKEIGIMKAVGARNSSIMALFLIESGTLGIVGGLIGVMLGVGFSYLIQVIASQVLGEGVLQPDFSILLIIGSLLFGFIVGAISGLVPARQASKLPPVEALRK